MKRKYGNRLLHFFYRTFSVACRSARNHFKKFKGSRAKCCFRQRFIAAVLKVGLGVTHRDILVEHTEKTILTRGTLVGPNKYY